MDPWDPVERLFFLLDLPFFFFVVFEDQYPSLCAFVCKERNFWFAAAISPFSVASCSFVRKERIFWFKTAKPCAYLSPFQQQGGLA